MSERRTFGGHGGGKTMAQMAAIEEALQAGVPVLVFRDGEAYRVSLVDGRRVETHLPKPEGEFVSLDDPRWLLGWRGVL